MKKIKLITPLLSVAAIGGTIAPLATSCAQVTTGVVVPTDLLDVVGYTLKGFKSGVDLSNYTVLNIPEGIKYIEEEAFADLFVKGSKTNIQAVVLPSTLKGIRKDAFKNCDSLRLFYMTNWTEDTIYYLDVAEGAFDGMSKVGQVLLNDNLTKEGKEKARSIFCDTGLLNSIWFEDESEDKMTADAAWKIQKKSGGRNATYLFTCNVTLPENAKIYAQVTRTGNTKGVDVECKESVTLRDTNVYEVKAGLLNQAETDDYADFAITFVAVTESENDVEFLWKETLTGFTLSNIKSEIIEVEDIELSADKTEIAPEETATITATVTPTTASSKELEWTSSNPAVATVEDGVVTGVADGTARIIATAKDGSGTKAYVDITVKSSTEMEYSADDFRFLTTNVTKLETNKSYTFIAKGESVTTTGYNFYPGKFSWYCGSSELGNATIDTSNITIVYTKDGEQTTLASTDYTILSAPIGNAISINVPKNWSLSQTNKATLSITVSFTTIPANAGNIRIIGA